MTPGHPTSRWDKTDLECKDINECSKKSPCSGKGIKLSKVLNLHNFLQPEKDVENCRNSHGSYECECIKGYKRYDALCEDIDECMTGENDCNNKAECINIPGGVSNGFSIFEP